MKKVFNVLGYISLLVIPYYIICFILVFFNPVRIISLIGIAILIAIQLIHYNKTKIKNIGIRLLVSILLLLIYNFLIYSGYGLAKNIEAKRIIENIEKIEIKNHEFSKEDLRTNMKFINERSIISKAKYDGKIYYSDGRVEDLEVLFSGVYIIELNNNKYYISILK